jgi:hypothetical protein
MLLVIDIIIYLDIKPLWTLIQSLVLAWTPVTRLILAMVVLELT